LRAFGQHTTYGDCVGILFLHANCDERHAAADGQSPMGEANGREPPAHRLAWIHTPNSWNFIVIFFIKIDLRII
jgi:hypothetical protein